MSKEQLLTALQANEFTTIAKLHEQSSYEWLDEYKEAYRNIDFLTYLAKNDCFIPPEAITLAAEERNMENIRFLHETAKVMWPQDILNIAAKNGDLTLLKYAHTHGCVESKAAESSFIDCMRPEKLFTAAEYAASEGHLECFMYANEHIREKTRITVEETTKFLQTASTTIVDMALGNRMPTDELLKMVTCFYTNEKIGMAAASKGQTHCLKYFFKEGGIVTSRIAYSALEKGYMDCFVVCMEEVALQEAKGSAPQGPFDGCCSMITLIEMLDKYEGELDCDKYPIFRGFFDVLDSKGLNENCFGKLNAKLKEKKEEIKLQKECAFRLVQKSLVEDVTNHVLMDFI